MTQRGETDVVALLRRRARQYRVMIPYLDAQRYAAEGQPIRALRMILTHPSTLGLLSARLKARAGRALRSADQQERLPAQGVPT
ncbi:MAG: hypothetical protein WDN49_17785 [Acetobacteraceae bacterium]